MPTTPDAIIAAITDAATVGFRGRLIARGQARAMIWRDGVLPLVRRISRLNSASIFTVTRMVCLD